MPESYFPYEIIPIPTYIYDYWIQHLSPHEFTVFIYICRKMLRGDRFYKSESPSEVEINYSIKWSVHKTLKNLEKKGLVEFWSMPLKISLTKKIFDTAFSKQRYCEVANV
jgi:hypothetical protein